MCFCVCVCMYVCVCTHFQSIQCNFQINSGPSQISDKISWKMQMTLLQLLIICLVYAFDLPGGSDGKASACNAGVRV